MNIDYDQFELLEQLTTEEYEKAIREGYEEIKHVNRLTMVDYLVSYTEGYLAGNSTSAKLISKLSNDLRIHMRKAAWAKMEKNEDADADWLFAEFKCWVEKYRYFEHE